MPKLSQESPDFSHLGQDIDSNPKTTYPEGIVSSIEKHYYDMITHAITGLDPEHAKVLLDCAEQLDNIGFQERKYISSAALAVLQSLQQSQNSQDQKA
jgi:phage major head subunit gpT-like protein